MAQVYVGHPALAAVTLVTSLCFDLRGILDY